MDDRQQAGASQLSVPQDAPSQTGKLNPMLTTPAERAGERELAQDSVMANAARANLQRLPMISGDTGKTAPIESDLSLDQIFASEKEALKQESKFEKRAKRQAGGELSRVADAQDRQAEETKALEKESSQPPAKTDIQTETQPLSRESQEQKVGQAEGSFKAEEESAPDLSKTPTVPLGPKTTRDAGKQRSSSANESAAKTKKKPRRSARRIVLIVVLALVCVYLLGFSWNQWMRGDDEIDIQGVWQIAGTENTITITKDHIQLTPDVKYPYTIDTAGKTITFSFAELSGVGRYRFSIDRNQLAIIEGPSFSAIGNTFSDAFWFGRSFFWWVFTQEIVSPGVETTAQRNQKEAAKQAEIDQEKEKEAQEAASEEIKAAASSDYVLGSQLIKKAQAIKGIRSNTKKEEGATVDLPTECTLLIRTDQPVEISNDEKPVMVIELNGSQSGGQADEQSDASQKKKPLIIEVPSTSSSGQSAEPSISNEASSEQPPESDGSS